MGAIERAIRSAVWWVIYSLQPKFLWKVPDAEAFGYEKGIPVEQAHAQFHDLRDTVESFECELLRDSVLFSQNKRNPPMVGKKVSFPVFY